MEIKIPSDVLKDFVTATSLLASEDSNVYLREDYVAVDSVLPVNNLMFFNLDGVSETGESIKIKLADFLGGVRLLIGKSIQISQEGPYKITIRAGNRKVSVSNAIISEDQIPTVQLGENTRDLLGQDIMPVLSTHKKNFVNSSVRTSIDGIFFLEEFALSTNEYSFLTTQLVSSGNRDLGMFLPSIFAKLIIAAKDTGVEFFITQDTDAKRTRLNFSRFVVIVPSSLFMPEEEMLGTIRGILDRAGNQKMSAKVPVEEMLEAIDARTINQSNAEYVSVSPVKDRMGIELVSAKGTQFNSSVGLEDSDFKSDTLNLPADEIAKMLDIISDYGRVEMSYDGELLVMFATKIDRFIVAKMN